MSNPVLLQKLLGDALEAQRLLDGLHKAWSECNPDKHVYTPDEFVMLIQRELCYDATERVRRRVLDPRKALTAEHAQRMRAAIEQSSDSNLYAVWHELLASCSKGGIPFDLMACACGYSARGPFCTTTVGYGGSRPLSREEMITCIGAVERWSNKGISLSI